MLLDMLDTGGDKDRSNNGLVKERALDAEQSYQSQQSGLLDDSERAHRIFSSCNSRL